MFNVRIYGLCQWQGKVLLCREPFQGRIVTKFPGGGLELGEGPEDGLLREFREETGQSAELIGHLYTTGFFIPSLRDPREQLISIYYRVRLPDPEGAEAAADPDKGIPELRWWPLDKLSPELFELPADRYVAERFL
jgi:8-oxo-dGTP diphosphatase